MIKRIENPNEKKTIRKSLTCIAPYTSLKVAFSTSRRRTEQGAVHNFTVYSSLMVLTKVSGIRLGYYQVRYLIFRLASKGGKSNLSNEQCVLSKFKFSFLNAEISII